jgi:selenide, water dikinase
VYRISDNLAIVQTLDFFTPIVDDPRIFGRAAAANSLSDVYAMGGRPVTAMNIVCFPTRKLGLEILREILEGGLEILREAGTALVGGHSVEDDEPKYGLSVTGLAHPDKIMTNSGLRPGDKLILTKAVGTGVIATAVKGGLASPASIDAMASSMCTLNKTASEVAVSFGAKACTDVTGFGLAGHLVEMARASKCRVSIRSGAVPVLEGSLEAASMGLIPAGAHANRKHFSRWITVGPEVSLDKADLMFDPQTSGGLVIGIPAVQAEELVRMLVLQGVAPVAEIGNVTGPDAEGHVEIV